MLAGTWRVHCSRCERVWVCTHTHFAYCITHCLAFSFCFRPLHHFLGWDIRGTFSLGSCHGNPSVCCLFRVPALQVGWVIWRLSYVMGRSLAQKIILNLNPLCTLLLGPVDEFVLCSLCLSYQVSFCINVDVNIGRFQNHLQVAQQMFFFKVCEATFS